MLACLRVVWSGEWGSEGRGARGRDDEDSKLGCSPGLEGRLDPGRLDVLVTFLEEMVMEEKLVVDFGTRAVPADGVCVCESV